MEFLIAWRDEKTYTRDLDSYIYTNNVKQLFTSPIHYNQIESFPLKIELLDQEQRICKICSSRNTSTNLMNAMNYVASKKKNKNHPTLKNIGTSTQYNRKNTMNKMNTFWRK